MYDEIIRGIERAVEHIKGQSAFTNFTYLLHTLPLVWLGLVVSLKDDNRKEVLL